MKLYAISNGQTHAHTHTLKSTHDTNKKWGPYCLKRKQGPTQKRQINARNTNMCYCYIGIRMVGGFCFESP